MAIKILLILFSALLLGNGTYFIKNNNRHFLMFNPQNYPTLSKILKISGTYLIIIALLGFAAAFSSNLILIILTLVLGCVGCVVPELLMMSFLNK